MTATTETTATLPGSPLIRGSDFLARTPGFKLVGREEYIEKLSAILMRKKANSVLLAGPGGVGLTALCMGLQASKDKPDAPFDIVNKRMYWLDVDSLFASGDTAQINEGFQKIMKTLSRDPDTILMVEDTKSFIEASRNSGCSHLINALTQAVRTGKFQVILEARDEDLDTVLKCHSDMKEYYTLLDVEEPNAEDLQKIVTEAAANLERHHGIRITPEAVAAAVEMTSKYRTRDLGLSRAQPERSITLLDRALTTYRLNAHMSPPGVDEMLSRLGDLNRAVNTGAAVPGLEGKSKEEIEILRAALESDIKEKREAWDKSQSDMRALYKEQRDGEEAIRRLEEDLDAQLGREEASREKARANGDMQQADAAAPSRSKISMFDELTAKGGLDSAAVKEIKGRISQIQKLVNENKEKFQNRAAEINKDLVLDRDRVLKEFGSISGIPASKLNQDEKVKLLGLEKTLSERVFGQEDAVERLSNAVITARIGRRKRDKPQAAFMFLGPSGVGKTEIAKALTVALQDDEAALLRFDMSEYMEKHAVAKLIGAPPGYEGFDVGGILTNAMRKNPNRIILFDEIEKAHPDVFNIFLQILSDGRLTDNVGRTVSFADSIILMTTNTGQPYFLDQNLSFAEAKEKAVEELGKTYRSELLNRFNGRQNIVCFNRLGLPEIEKIVKREIGNINKAYGDQGLNIEMPDESLKAFCADKYDPAVGARGLPGYIEAMIEPKIAKAILERPDAKGTMNVRYDGQTGSLEIDPPQIVPANQNARPAAGGPAAAFNMA